MAFLPENLPPLNNDPNESSEDESPMENPHHFRKGIMDQQFDCSDSLQFWSHTVDQSCPSSVLVQKSGLVSVMDNSAVDYTVS